MSSVAFATPQMSGWQASSLVKPAALSSRQILKSRSIRTGYLSRSRNYRKVGRIVTKAVALPQTAEKSKRKVAIFVEPSPFSHISGMKNRFLGLIESLDKEGDEVVVITPCSKSTKEYKGVRVMSIFGFTLPNYPTKTLLVSTAMSPFVIWELLTNRPDIIHVSAPGFMVFTILFYARILRIPCVVSYHTHIPEYVPRYNMPNIVAVWIWECIRLVSRWSSLCLVTSSVMEDELKGKGCKKIDLWKRGVDTMRFNPSFRSEDMKREMCEGRDGPLLVHVGRLGAEKNIKVLKGILEKVPNANLAIVGDGPLRQELESHFQGTRTKFMGMMSGDALSQAYASADVFLMPSESETLGFVVLEAMASQVPVVSVAAGGLTDIIVEDGKMGLLYPPGDYDLAAKLVNRLIDEPDFHKKVAKGGFDEVQKWSFHASNVFLRENQYPQAIRRLKLMDRFKSLIMHIRILSFLRGLFHFITFGLFRSSKKSDRVASAAYA